MLHFCYINDDNTAWLKVDIDKQSQVGNFMRHVIQSVLLSSCVLATGSSAAAYADPYVECHDGSEEIFLGGTDSTPLYFITSASEFSGIASELLRELRLGWSARGADLLAYSAPKCHLADNNRAFGIESIDCDQEPGESLFLNEGDRESEVTLASGSIRFDRNMYYEGYNRLSIDVTSTGGSHASVVRNFTYDACTVRNL